jgi:UDP-glucose 4-epimerase
LHIRPCIVEYGEGIWQSGVGWPGDVKRIALKIDKIKKLGFKPAMNSREAVRVATRKLLEEINANIP